MSRNKKRAAESDAEESENEDSASDGSAEQSKVLSANEQFIADFRIKFYAVDTNDRGKLWEELKSEIDGEYAKEELKSHSESFRSEMLDSLKPNNFIDEEWEAKDRVVPQVLVGLAEGLECTDYSIETADYHVSTNIDIDFGPFSVSRAYNGDNEGSGCVDHTILAGRHRVVSEDSYFTDDDLTQVYKYVQEKLPGVSIEHFRTFCGSVFDEDFEF